MSEVANESAAPSRQMGLDRMTAFAPRMGGDYARLRNFDFGPSDRSNVSMLSPYLRHRLILEREVVAEALSAHGPEAAEKFIQEVFWRTYWKGWLERHPGVWAAYLSDLEGVLTTCERDADLARRLADAEAGKTGLACFDAWARELVETGYLHNHARMWMASLWVFTLGLPWQIGADFFLRHLLDGDPASNTLGWRWVSGLQTPGKTYLARADNIAKFTDGRFAPAPADMADAAPATSVDARPSISAAPVSQALQAGPGVGLLICEEDLCPETLPGVSPDRLDAAAAISAVDYRSPRGVGAEAMMFTIGALEECCQRVETGGGPPVKRLNANQNRAQAIVDWAVAAELQTVVTAYVPQGPVRAVIEAARPLLQDQGIGLAMILRDWDARAWQHADRGFFPFKKNIPTLIGLSGLCGG